MTFFERLSADFDPDRIETTFRRALQENGFRFLPEYNSYLQWLRKTLQPQRCLDLESFELAGLTSLLDPFLVKHDPRHKLLTYVYPRTGLWLKTDLANLTADMQRAASERRLAPTEWRISGFPMLTHYLKQQVWHDLGKTIVFASLAIVFLVLVAFRQPLSATLAAIPLVAALMAMLGIMALTSIRFNYANFIVIPIMIGICVNDGVLIISYRDRSHSYR